MADRNPNTSGGSHPIGPPAKKFPAWLFPLIAVLVLAVLLLLLVKSCGGGSDATSTAPATTTAAATPAATATIPPTTGAATTPAATSTAGAGAGRGTITAGGGPLLPLAEATKVGGDGDLSAYTGTDARAIAVAVQSVPANEGFWVGSSDTDRVWVQLSGKGESPYTVKKGDAVSFTGKVVKNAPGFATAVGVSDPEGAKLLDAQGQHITVDQNAVKLAK